MKKMDLVLQGAFNEYTREIALHYLELDFVNNIIISCWENNLVPFIDNRVIIIKSKDLENPGVGNRNRQIKTSLEGLKAVQTTFGAKLRSDQKISLDSMNLMYDFYNLHQEKEITFYNKDKPNNRICVAGIFRPFPFHPRDHIFWGNTQDLIDVFDIPYDNVSLNDDYSKYTRAETYICMWYCAKFDPDIVKLVNDPTKFLVDNAPNINESLAKSNQILHKIFKPFPKIDLEWPKHGLRKYHYDLTASHFGEYWDD